MFPSPLPAGSTLVGFHVYGLCLQTNEQRDQPSCGTVHVQAESHLWFCSGVDVSYSVGSFGGTSYLTKIIQKFFF